MPGTPHGRRPGRVSAWMRWSVATGARPGPAGIGAAPRCARHSDASPRSVQLRTGIGPRHRSDAGLTPLTPLRTGRWSLIALLVLASPRRPARTAEPRDRTDPRGAPGPSSAALLIVVSVRGGSGARPPRRGADGMSPVTAPGLPMTVTTREPVPVAAHRYRAATGRSSLTASLKR